ncbi:Far upstream element-binding protein 1 [Apophysomyces sp. BC1015]|nr:Far upstream element-binding protein 1 [Apophysomyces sp. BC1015]
MEGENKPNYSAVPPPDSLSAAASAPVNFNDALSKARAIAEKLKQQSAAAAPAPPVAAPSGYFASAGSKRSYQDDPYDDERDESHARSQGSHYDGYYDDRESKRSAYDRGSSRPYSSSGNEPRRYGLGSDERKSMSSYGPSSAGSMIQEECAVPNHIVGLVIGKGGENLKKIERMSGAKVQFTADTGDVERRVNMTGEADQVKIARDMIQQVVDDARVTEAARHGGRPESAAVSSALNMPRGNGLVMTIPASKVGLVIGRGGETIRDLEERSGAKITVTPESSAERPHERTVNLLGDTAAIQRAKSFIDEIVNEDAKSVAPSRDWAAYRQQHYPTDDARRSYGRDEEAGAEGASRPAGEYYGTGANAPVDRYGPSSGQDRAYGGGGGGGFRGRFNEDCESIKVPRSAVGFIIGRGGETVRALQDQSGARIKVDPNAEADANERTINIFGKSRDAHTTFHFDPTVDCAFMPWMIDGLA